MSVSVVDAQNVIRLVAAEVNPDGSLTITLVEGDRYYRLLNVTPDFEPVDPNDKLTRPRAFSDALQSRFTTMGECHSAGQFGYQTYEDTIEMFYLDQLELLAPGESLTFAEASRRAEERMDCYPSTPTELIPAAAYHWAKVAATAWHSLKSRLGE